MIDQRFKREVCHLDQSRRRQVAESLELDGGQIERIVDAIKGCWQAAIHAGTLDRESVREYFESAASEAGFSNEPVATAVWRLLADQPATDGPVDDKAAILVGHSLGESIADGPAEGRFVDLGHEIVEGRELGWLSLDDAFVKSCQPNSEKSQQWAKALSQLPSELSKYVESIDRQKVSGLRREKLEDPTEIWSNHGYFIHIDSDLSARMLLLANLSIPSLIQALDAVPSHILQSQILDHLNLYKDRDLLLSALKEASPVYENGEWTGCVCLFLLMEEVVRHAERLSATVERSAQLGSAGPGPSILSGNSTPPSTLSELRNSELKDWLLLAFSTILERQDGVRVAVEYAAKLVARTLSEVRRNGRTKNWDANELARDVLLERLATTKLVGADIKAMAPRSCQAATRRSPLEALIVLGCIDHARRASTQAYEVNPDPSFVWRWYEELLDNRDSGLAAHVNPYGMPTAWAFAALGSALLSQPNPAESWLATWSRLYQQRQAARFFAPGDDLLAPSMHLLRVACNASLVRGPGEVGDADRRLWQVAQLRATQLFLSGLLMKLPLEQIGPWTFFPVVPHMMGDSWQAAVRECKWIFNTSDISALLSANALIQNGIEPASVNHAFKEIGCDLVHVGQRLEQWLIDSGREKQAYVDISAIMATFQQTGREIS